MHELFDEEKQPMSSNCVPPVGPHSAACIATCSYARTQLYYTHMHMHAAGAQVLLLYIFIANKLCMLICVDAQHSRSRDGYIAHHERGGLLFCNSCLAYNLSDIYSYAKRCYKISAAARAQRGGRHHKMAHLKHQHIIACCFL